MLNITTNHAITYIYKLAFILSGERDIKSLNCKLFYEEIS